MKVHVVLAIFCLMLLFFAASCSGISNESPTIPAAELDAADMLPVAGNDGFPGELPEDRLQPWETERSASIFPIGVHEPGRNWFDASEGVAISGQAAVLPAGGSPGSYVIHRIPAGGTQPGSLTLDVLDGDGEFHVAIANYGSGRWDWSGPHETGSLVLSPALQVREGADYLSGVGNIFLAILNDGPTEIELLGIGIRPLSESDETAPDMVSGLSASAAAGGVELAWDPVDSPDLAGYLIHSAGHYFINRDSAGVTAHGIQPSPGALLSGLEGPTYFRVSAIDRSGNIGPASDAVAASPLPGMPAQLSLTLSDNSPYRGEALSLTASGAESYDFDLDGDGVYEIDNQSLGVVEIATPDEGVYRPRVRGRDISGSTTAIGTTAYIVIVNQNPTAILASTTPDGLAPLLVSLSGIAADAEDLPEQLSFAWDLDGDGYYEQDTNTLSPPDQLYEEAGRYKPRFRVTDSRGAYGVDSRIFNAEFPSMLRPRGVIEASASSGMTPLIVSFDASASLATLDEQPGPLEFRWDFSYEADEGIMVEETGSQPSFLFAEPGIYTVLLEVENEHGYLDIDKFEIDISDWNSPVSVLEDVWISGMTALAGVDGNPAMAFHDSMTDSIGYIRALDAGGTSWGSLTTVVSGVQSSQGTSMLVIGGNPAISYLDAQSGEIMYVSATDSSGSSWGNPVAAASAGDSAGRPALEVINGAPAIAYFTGDTQDLM